MSSDNKANIGQSISRAGAKFVSALLYDQPPSPKDQRHRDPRNPVAGEVIIRKMHTAEAERAEHRVFIRDLSKGGCGVWARTRFQQGSSVLLVFQGPDGQPVQRTGVVRHCRGQEGTGFAVGIQFDREDAKKTKAA